MSDQIGYVAMLHVANQKNRRATFKPFSLLLSTHMEITWKVDGHQVLKACEDCAGELAHNLVLRHHLRT